MDLDTRPRQRQKRHASAFPDGQRGARVDPREDVLNTGGPGTLGSGVLVGTGVRVDVGAGPGVAVWVGDGPGVAVVVGVLFATAEGVMVGMRVAVGVGVSVRIGKTHNRPVLVASC